MRVSRVVRAPRAKLASDPHQIARLHKKAGVNMGVGCTIYGGAGFGSEPYLASLGDNVRITAGVQFVTHDGGMHVLRQFPGLEDLDRFGPIVVGSNVFIGIRSIIMPGVTIGNNCVIGAGSIVTRDVPDNCVAAGVPAKVLRDISQYRAKAIEGAVRTKGLSASAKRAFLESHYGID